MKCHTTNAGTTHSTTKITSVPTGGAAAPDIMTRMGMKISKRKQVNDAKEECRSANPLSPEHPVHIENFALGHTDPFHGRRTRREVKRNMDAPAAIIPNSGTIVAHAAHADPPSGNFHAAPHSGHTVQPSSWLGRPLMEYPHEAHLRTKSSDLMAALGFWQSPSANRIQRTQEQSGSATSLPEVIRA